MLLTLIDFNAVRQFPLPERVSGRYRLTDQAAVEENGGAWLLKTGKGLRITRDRKSYSATAILNPAEFAYILENDNGQTAMLMVDPDLESRRTYSRYLLPAGTEIRIGRDPSCHICAEDPFISSFHARIWEQGGKMYLEDLKSVNGTYLNGRHVTSAELSPGDFIHIMGMQIIVGRGFLAVNREVRDAPVRSGLAALEPQILPDLTELPEDEEPEDDGSLFSRSPRFKRDVETAHFTIDSPPPPAVQEGTPMMLMLGPSLTMGMASLFTGIFSAYNVISNNGSWTSAMPAIVMAASMLLGTVMWPILTKMMEKRRRERKEQERKDKYRIYLQGMRQKIEGVAAGQAEILRENCVTLDDCIGRIRSQSRNLWERMYRHNDFLSLRLGVGSLPMDAEIRYADEKFSLEEDVLEKEMYAFCQEPHMLQQVPVSFSLRDSYISGLIGPRTELIPYLKGMIFQLAALHSYDEVKFVFLLPESEAEEWDFVKWMPHTWNEDRTLHFIADQPYAVKEISGKLEKVFHARDDNNQSAEEEYRPWYVIFALDKGLTAQSELVRQILASKECRGFSLIIAREDVRQLPKECMQVAEVCAGTGKLFQPDDIHGQATLFRPDISINGPCRDMAVKLANIRLDTGVAKQGMPDMITFLQLFRVGKVEHLNALTRWKEHDPSRTLQTEVGIDGDGEVFYLDYHQNYHGPHGLVAGMTGSGKSEFIMTFILSLAVNYHPNEVSFILIDYKGGGMAKAFEKLPHTVGIITNLDGSSINRSLVSIESELARREKIFQEVSKAIGVSNIDIYKYQQLFREGKVEEPLQHLFIISDEFAELKDQQRDFMDKLVSAARIGRSLGVHLILATQKPNGVVDEQIWSNSRCRICLKVQERSDSVEMIKRPDAAELTKTGRFYMLVGYNEIFEIGQSAWGGASYIPSDRPQSSKDNKVSILDGIGHVLRQGEIKRKARGDSRKQLDSVVTYLANLAEEEGIKIRPMWEPPLEERIDYHALLKKYHLKPAADYHPVAGEADDPARQRQYPVTLALDSNLALYGTAGSGKTTLITTLLYAAMESHTPDQFQAYLLDFGAETLRVFAKAPHVGDVLFSGDDEKVKNLFKMLFDEMGRRKRLCSEFGGDLASYRKSSGKAMPNILIVIQNYAGFIESYDDLETQVAVLSREGSKYGLTFLLTAVNTNAIRYRTLQNFGQLVTMQLNDKSEYSAVFGATGGVQPSPVKGRGLYREGQALYEFQSASVGGEDSAEFIREFCRKTAGEWKGQRAPRVPILPERVTFSFVESAVDGENLVFPIGVEKESLQLSLLKVGARPIHYLMSQTGQTPFAGALASLIARELGDRMTVMDGSGDLAGCCKQYYSGGEKLNALVVEIFQELVYRHNHAKELVEAGEPAPVYESRVYLVGGMSEVLNQLSPDAQDKLHVLLDKCTTALGIFFIVSDGISNLSAYSYRPWFKKQGTLNTGIWAGDGIGEQFLMKVKSSQSLYEQIGPDFGYMAADGRAVLVKLITNEE